MLSKNCLYSKSNLKLSVLHLSCGDIYIYIYIYIYISPHIYIYIYINVLLDQWLNCRVAVSQLSGSFVLNFLGTKFFSK